MELDKLYKVCEVAEILNVSQVVIYKWIKNGLVKCIRIGGVIRIKESEIKRVMENVNS